MSFLRWVTAITLVAACGDDSAPPLVFDAAMDVFVRDSGSDASEEDAGDAATDTGDVDSGDMDAGLDSGTDAGPPPCDSVTVDVFDLATAENGRPRRVHVAAGSDRFVVSWEENRLGQRDVFGRVVPATGDPADEVGFTNSFDVTEEPAALDRGDALWLLYRDNRDGNFEIYLERRMGDLSTGEAAQRLTDDALRNERPLIAPLASGALVAWTDSDGLGMSDFRSVAVANDGTPGTVQMPLPGRGTSQSRMRTWGDGAVVAFAEPLEAGGIDAHVVRLAADGTATGTAAAMSSGADVSGSVDAAENGGVGLYVFGATDGAGAREIRVRPLNSTARPRAPEELPLFMDVEASDPSVAPWGEGFVVSHRALAGTDVSGPMVRVSFVDEFGRVSNTIDVATAATRESPTWVDVTPAGTILVGWADVTTETVIRAGRLQCGG